MGDVEVMECRARCIATAPSSPLPPFLSLQQLLTLPSSSLVSVVKLLSSGPQSSVMEEHAIPVPPIGTCADTRQVF